MSVPGAADLAGRTFLVTGATSGIGWSASRQLAARGARVLLAARDRGRGKDALARIAARVPDARLDLVDLDLADLGSVRAAAERVAAMAPDLDVLVNNAGVMGVPRRETVDGHELQWQTNHLGHFALTGLLLPRMLQRPAPRVVTITSMLAERGRIDFGDLDGRRSYRPFTAYRQSKLANAMFAVELDRRATAAAVPLRSLAAHPGYTATKLQLVAGDMPGSGVGGRSVGRARNAVMRLANGVLGQDAEAGAWPTVEAATARTIQSGVMVAPGGLGGLRGAPRAYTPYPRAVDADAGRRLWQVSEEQTGVRMPV